MGAAFALPDSGSSLVRCTVCHRISQPHTGGALAVHMGMVFSALKGGIAAMTLTFKDVVIAWAILLTVGVMSIINGAITGDGMYAVLFFVGFVKTMGFFWLGFWLFAKFTRWKMQFWRNRTFTMKLLAVFAGTLGTTISMTLVHM
jgi:hypothetical protein